MPITPEAAGFNRGLNESDTQLLKQLEGYIDEAIKNAYRQNPRATGVYVDRGAYPGWLFTKLQAAYENVGWHVRFDKTKEGNDRIIFVPKEGH